MIVIFTSTVVGQKLEINKTFFGDPVIQNGKKLSLSEVIILSENKGLNTLEFEDAKNYKLIGYTSGIIGSSVLLYSLGTFIAGNNVNPIYVGMGLGFVGANFYLNNRANRSISRGVILYNDALSFNPHKPDFLISATTNSLRLTVKF